MKKFTGIVVVMVFIFVVIGIVVTTIVMLGSQANKYESTAIPVPTAMPYTPTEIAPVPTCTPTPSGHNYPDLPDIVSSMTSGYITNVSPVSDLDLDNMTFMPETSYVTVNTPLSSTYGGDMICVRLFLNGQQVVENSNIGTETLNNGTPMISNDSLANNIVLVPFRDCDSLYPAMYEDGVYKFEVPDLGFYILFAYTAPNGNAYMYYSGNYTFVGNYGLYYYQEADNINLSLNTSEWTPLELYNATTNSTEYYNIPGYINQTYFATLNDFASFEQSQAEDAQLSTQYEQQHDTQLDSQ
jgi:hypothetical protein